MDADRLLECLSQDYQRLQEVVALDPKAPVPTCPGWTVTDLTRHVAEVYLHKTEAMRTGVEPEAWPPPTPADESPAALLERAYADLRVELDSRRPSDPAGTWYTPDQTVGFWIRRMAHETVIHRVDAELATRRSVAAIPDDLAVDGIDELLRVFVAYSVAEWGDYFTDLLDDAPPATFALQTARAAWQVSTGPGLFAVTDGEPSDPDVTIAGAPPHLLRWMWNRDTDPSGVTVDGSPDSVQTLRRVVATATQ